jgi:HNH endonuclease/NUMOD3 motif
MKPEGIILPNLSNYIITEHGTVWSLIRNRYLKPAIHNLGYRQFYLKQDNSTKRWFKAHRLVAIAYIPNIDNKPEVNHRDGNKANNHKDNLEWMTHKENIIHSFEVLDRTTRIISGKDHWNYGKTVSNETKSKQSAKKQGINHPKFKGYYSYLGKESTSLNALAKELNTYPMELNRLFKKGLIDFRAK